LGSRSEEFAGKFGGSREEESRDKGVGEEEVDAESGGWRWRPWTPSTAPGRSCSRGPIPGRRVGDWSCSLGGARRRGCANGRYLGVVPEVQRWDWKSWRRRWVPP
jgi:hypothetical protein